MSPRRFLTVLGPAVGIGALVVGLGCGCLTWTTDVPGPAAFVSGSLAEAYGITLSSRGRTEISLLPLPRLGFRDVRLDADGPEGGTLVEGANLSMQLGLTALLFGRVEVVSLALDGGTLTLPSGSGDRRWAEPMRRFTDRLAAGDAAHPRRITLARLTVTGHDPGNGNPQSASGVDATLSWPLWSDALNVNGGFSWHGASARFALAGLKPRGLADGAASPFTGSLTSTLR